MGDTTWIIIAIIAGISAFACISVMMFTFYKCRKELDKKSKKRRAEIQSIYQRPKDKIVHDWDRL